MADRSQGMWNLALQPLKTSHLQYNNAYDYQTPQGGNLPWGAPTHEITLPFDRVVLQDHATD